MNILSGPTRILRPWFVFGLIGLVVPLFSWAQTIPAWFSTNITVGGSTVSVTFSNYPIRSANYAVNIQQADGSWGSFDPGPPSTYLGTVAGHPGAFACGTLLTNGQFWAKICFEAGNEWVYFSGPSARAYNRGGNGGFGINYPGSPVLSLEGGAGPNIYAAEIAVDSGWNHFNACGQDPYRTVMAVEHSILSGTYFYIRDNGVLHQLGAIYIRANYDQDPYHTISSAGGKLDHCRVFLSGIDTTHDVGTVADSIGGGVAWVGTIGTWVKYSACGFNGGENGDFSQVWRHEVGHNWNCGDYEGGGTEGVTIMNGNALARCSGSEQNKIINLRNGKLGILDNLGPSSFPLPPRASLDAVMAIYPNAVTIDVLRNDHSPNGLPILVLSFDQTSARGGSILQSTLDPRQLVYMPPANSPLGADKFSYRITDSEGRTGLGYVYILVDPPANDIAGHWPLDEGSGTVARDGSGSGNNGTVQNQNSWRSGILGSALEFDGSAMEVSVAPLHLNTNTVTITCWVRRKGSQNSYAGLVFSRGGGTVAGLDLRGTSNQLGYHWNDGFYNYTSGLTLPDNQWAFCALVVEPNRAVFYMDDGTGLRSATNNAPHAVQSFSSTLYIGRDPNGGRYFNGTIDDVHVFRRALAPSEVAQIAAGSGPAHSPSPVSGASIFGGTATLQWLNPGSAVAQQVYIGSDYEAVAAATTSSPEYQGTVAGTQFQPLIGNGTWYWRIDEVIGGQVIRGPVWFFGYSSGDPVARWKLDELAGTIAREYIGSYHGTYVNGPLLGQAGVLIEPTNSAARFNGSNQRVVVPYSSALNSGSFTIEVWCKVTSGQGTWRSPLTSREESPSRGYNFYAGQDNRWQFWTGTGSGAGWNQISGPSVVLNEWVQLVGVVDGNYQSFYVNGVLAAGSQAAFSPNTSRASNIGSGDGTYYFPGFVDDIRLYDRPLTAGEIASRYQQSVNQAPFFVSNPMVLPVAPIGQAYSNSLAGKIADPNPEDTIRFSKLSGPGWISVASNGAVTGTPLAGDAGINTFEVRATDGSGAFALSTVQISVGGTVWNGGGNNNHWNQAANWSGTLPTTGQGVGFAGLARRANTNNLLSTVGQISFLAPGFSLYGSGITLTNGILSFKGPSLCAIPLTFTSPQTFLSSNETLTIAGSINNNGHALQLAGQGDVVLSGGMSGSGGLTKSGPGALSLNNNQTYSGNTILSGGTVTAAGGVPSAASYSSLGQKSGNRTVTVENGALLWLTPVEGAANTFGGAGMTANQLPRLVLNGGTARTGKFNTIGHVTLQNGGRLSNASTETGPNYGGYQFIGDITVFGSAGTLGAFIENNGPTPAGRGNHLRGGASTTFNVGNITDGKIDLTISAPVRDGSGDYPGAGSLVKSGPGTMVLSGTNTYTGGTAVSAGTLIAQYLEGNQPLGTGPVNLTGGTLALQGPTAIQSLGLSGYNHDVIFASTEFSASSGTTRGIDSANYVFYEVNVPGSGGIGGLPGDRTFVSQADNSVSFDLQPYTGNNALSLGSGSGVLTLAAPKKISKIFLLHTSGSGSSSFSVSLNFTDGTSRVASGLTATDWGISNATVALVIKGRASRAGAVETGATWYLFQSQINLSSAEQDKALASVTITRTGGSGVLSVFGASAEVLNGAVAFANSLALTTNSAIDLRGSEKVHASGVLAIAGSELAIVGMPTAAFESDGPVTLTGDSIFRVGVSNAIFSGGMLGSGGLTKLGAGRLTLSAPGTYSGNTWVNEGRLVLDPSVTLASGNIVVSAGAFLSANPGLALNPAQTLKGGGTVLGAVTVQGRISPGESVGKLTIFGNAVLEGTAEMEFSKVPATNDQLVASGEIIYGGTLRIEGLDAAVPTAGDVFKLFSATSYSGAFANIIPENPGPGLVWDASGLLLDGTLRAVSVVNLTPTNLVLALAGNELTLSWPEDYTGWTLQAKTNSLSEDVPWADVQNSAGTNRVIIQIDSSQPAVFYRMKF